MANKWATAPQQRQQRILMGPSLDEQIALDDPVRLLDEILLGLDWTEWESVYSDGAGRPPIHPRLMAGSILHGMMNRIRSSRDLETATRMRVDFHWFLGCMSIDHSTFARFRNHFGDKLEGLLKDLNKEARKLIEAGPKRVAIDGTCMRANSDRHGARTATCLQAKLESLQAEFSQIMAEMDMLDAMDALDSASIAALEKRKTELEKQQLKLEKALAVARERDEAKRQKDGAAAREVRVPVTDSDSSLLLNKDGGYAPNYTATAAVDTGSGLILHADVPPGSDEASAVQPAVEATGETFGHKPEQVLCDSHFVSGENLEYLAAEGVEVIAPSEAAREDNPAMRSDPTEPIGEEEIATIVKRKGKLGKALFAYDAEADCYHCPLGRTLPFDRTVKRRKKGGGKMTVRQYKCSDCSGCPLARKCLNRKAKARTVSRDQYEPLREELAARMRTDAAREIYSQRAPAIEGVFGYIKGVMHIRAFLTRGHQKVRTEWRWICSAYSMRKLMGLLAAERAECADSDQDNAPGSRNDPARSRNPVLFRAFRQTTFAVAA